LSFVQLGEMTFVHKLFPQVWKTRSASGGRGSKRLLPERGGLYPRLVRRRQAGWGNLTTFLHPFPLPSRAGTAPGILAVRASSTGSPRGSPKRGRCGEADVSAQYSETQEDARVPRQDENASRSQDPRAEAQQGTGTDRGLGTPASVCPTAFPSPRPRAGSPDGPDSASPGISAGSWRRAPASRQGGSYCTFARGSTGHGLAWSRAGGSAGLWSATGRAGC
jgi:hypothetical protein